MTRTGTVSAVASASTRPPMVSWSVTAMTSSLAAWAARTSSPGESSPSEARVCRWRSARCMGGRQRAPPAVAGGELAVRRTGVGLLVPGHAHAPVGAGAQVRRDAQGKPRREGKVQPQVRQHLDVELAFFVVVDELVGDGQTRVDVGREGEVGAGEGLPGRKAHLRAEAGGLAHDALPAHGEG